MAQSMAQSKPNIFITSEKGGENLEEFSND